MNVSLYVLGLVLVTVLLSLIDLRTLLKKKEIRELFIVVCLFSIGFILNFLLIVGAKLPNPNKFIVTIIQMFKK